MKIITKTIDQRDPGVQVWPPVWLTLAEWKELGRPTRIVMQLSAPTTEEKP